MRSAHAIFTRLVIGISISLTSHIAMAQRDTSGIGGDPPQRRKSEEKPAPSPDDPAAFHVIMSHSKLEWSALRFNQRTGETWTPNREHDPDWVWEKSHDLGDVPLSDYEFRLVSYVSENKHRKLSVRMDRRSGKSWVLSGDTWYPVAEADGFESATAPASGFRLIMSSVVNAWEVIRFNPETGAAWMPKLTDNRQIWQKIAETAEPPPSDFDLQAVLFPGKDAASSTGKVTVNARTMRMDRKTGRGWLQSDGGWNELLELEGFADTPAPAGGFRWIVAASPVNWYAYRYNPETGATWVPAARDGKSVWNTIAEGNSLQRGDYDVQVVCWVNENGGVHNVFRINRKVGWMWIGSNDEKWEFINERPDITSSQAPASGFRLLTTNSEKSWYALRFNPESGEVWVPNEDGDDWYADRWADNPALPKSKYDVQMTSFIDGDDGTENVYRMDLQSGRCWNFNQKWLPVPFSPPDTADLPRPPGGFQMILCPSPNACNPFRFNPTNGDTWGVNAEQPLLWEKIVDTDALPTDTYELKAISFLAKDDATFDSVFRINCRTGQTWYASEHRWVVIAEPK